MRSPGPAQIRLSNLQLNFKFTSNMKTPWVQGLKALHKHFVGDLGVGTPGTLDALGMGAA